MFLKWTGISLGLGSLGFFVFDLVLILKLQPRMVAFEILTPAEVNLFNWTGVGLLIFLGFCLASLLRSVNYLRRAPRVTILYIAMIISGILAFLFTFSDIALLSDIVKQYRLGLGQPEWLLLYPLMVFQFLMLLATLYLHVYAFRPEDLLHQVALDSNIFLIVQYVGLLCGLLGLAFSSLGYIFPGPWKLTIHTLTSMILFMTPYGLAVGYWLMTKLLEKDRRLYDEKQSQDIGRSAFFTLLMTAILMVCLFIANFNDLGGVTSMLWLPIWLFSSVFFFSLGIVYLSWKEL